MSSPEQSMKPSIFIRERINRLQTIRHPDTGQLLTTFFNKSQDADFRSRVTRHLTLDDVKSAHYTTSSASPITYVRDVAQIVHNYKEYYGHGSEAAQYANLLETFNKQTFSSLKTLGFGDAEYPKPADLSEVKPPYYKVGDWVLLKNPIDPTKPTVAQIHHVTEKEGPFRCCWFYRPEQTSHRVDRLFLPNEVFKTKVMRNCSLLDIEGRCFVQFFQKFRRGSPILDYAIPSSRLFVCQYRYNVEKHTFGSIHQWPGCLPESVRDQEIKYRITHPDGKTIKKLESPLIHCLPANASIQMPLPKPAIPDGNDPPSTGSVYLRAKDPTDTSGQYSTSSVCPNWIIRPDPYPITEAIVEDPQAEAQPAESTTSRTHTADPQLFSILFPTPQPPISVPVSSSNSLYDRNARFFHRIHQLETESTGNKRDIDPFSGLILIDFIEWQFLSLGLECLDFDQTLVLAYINRLIAWNVLNCSTRSGTSTLITAENLRSIYQSLQKVFVVLGADQQLPSDLLDIKFENIGVLLKSMEVDEFVSHDLSLIRGILISGEPLPDASVDPDSSNSSSYHDAEEGERLVDSSDDEVPNQKYLDGGTFQDSQGIMPLMLQAKSTTVVVAQPTIEESIETEPEEEGRVEEVHKEDTQIEASNSATSTSASAASTSSKTTEQGPIKSPLKPVTRPQTLIIESSEDSIHNGTSTENETARKLQNTLEDLPPDSNEISDVIFKERRRPQNSLDDPLPSSTEDHFLAQSQPVLTSTQIPVTYSPGVDGVISPSHHSNGKQDSELQSAQSSHETEEISGDVSDTNSKVSSTSDFSQVFNTAPSQIESTAQRGVDEVNIIKDTELGEADAEAEAEAEAEAAEESRDHVDHDIDSTASSTQQMPPPPPPPLPQSQGYDLFTQPQLVRHRVEVPATPSPSAFKVLSLNHTHNDMMDLSSSEDESRYPIAAGNKRINQDTDQQRGNSNESYEDLPSSPANQKEQNINSTPNDAGDLDLAALKAQNEELNKGILALQVAMNQTTEFSNNTAANVDRIMGAISGILQRLDSNKSDFQPLLTELKEKLQTLEAKNDTVNLEVKRKLKYLHTKLLIVSKPLDIQSQAQETSDRIESRLLQSLHVPYNEVIEDVIKLEEESSKLSDAIEDLKQKFDQQFLTSDQLNGVLKRIAIKNNKTEDRVTSLESKTREITGTVGTTATELKKFAERYQNECYPSKISSLQEQIDYNHVKLLDKMEEINRKNGQLSIKNMTLSHQVEKLAEENKDLVRKNQLVQDKMDQKDRDFEERLKKLERMITQLQQQPQSFISNRSSSVDLSNTNGTKSAAIEAPRSASSALPLIQNPSQRQNPTPTPKAQRSKSVAVEPRFQSPTPTRAPLPDLTKSLKNIRLVPISVNNTRDESGADQTVDVSNDTSMNALKAVNSTNVDDVLNDIGSEEDESSQEKKLNRLQVKKLKSNRNDKLKSKEKAKTSKKKKTKNSKENSGSSFKKHRESNISSSSSSSSSQEKINVKTEDSDRIRILAKKRRHIDNSREDAKRRKNSSDSPFPKSNAENLFCEDSD